MNKNGFTTVELILTMVLVITIMATITSVTYTYRDRSNYEQIVTEVNDYKNKVTKIIYDDILNKENGIVGLKQDSLNDKTFYFVDENDNNVKSLIIIDETNRVGISYDGIDYLIPNTSYEGYELYPAEFSEDNNIFGLDINFKNKYLEDKFKIHFVIS